MNAPALSPERRRHLERLAALLVLLPGGPSAEVAAAWARHLLSAGVRAHEDPAQQAKVEVHFQLPPPDLGRPLMQIVLAESERGTGCLYIEHILPQHIALGSIHDPELREHNANALARATYDRFRQFCQTLSEKGTPS